MTPEQTGIKVPCEMAIFALREKVTSQVGIYLASHFRYSGTAKNTSQIVRDLSVYLPIKDRQIRRGVNWLLDRNWIHKSRSGWYYFRSIDNIHRLEGWRFSRATKFNSKDLKHIQAYLAASVLTSLVETGKQEKGKVPLNRGTHTPRHPVSLSSLMKILNCSKKTAQRYVKQAVKYSYIKSEENLAQIDGLTPITLKHLRCEGFSKIKVKLFGSSDSKIIAMDRIRYKDGNLFFQEPNLIGSMLTVKSRRGLKKSNPYRDNNGGQI